MPRGRRGEEAEGGEGPSGTSKNIGRDRSGRERRKVRRGLRNLISSLEQNRSELVSPKSDGLHHALHKASRIYKHVSDTRETALDAEFLSLASRLGVEKTSKIKTSLKESYDPHQFVANLKAFVKGAAASGAADSDEEELEATQTQVTQTQRRGASGGDFNWHALGTRVQHLFKATPRVDFMYGPLNAEPPQRKERKQRTRDVIAEQKVAEEGIDHDNQIGRMTSARVEEVRTLVRKNPNKNLKQLLVNATSYGQTVENFFHFAFLVKDGFVTHTPDTGEGEGTVVEPAEQPSKEDYAQGVAERKQCIMRLDYATFERLAKEVPKPMLKTQDYSNIEALVAKRKAIIAAANERHEEREMQRKMAEEAAKQAAAARMDVDEDD